MNIAIDIGNSTIKVGYFENSLLLNQLVFPDFSALITEIKGKYDAKLIVSSVADIPNELNQSINNFSYYHILDHRSALPFTVDYSTPETLGLDRIAAAAGALIHYNGPLLIIDAGTCITCDFIDANNVFRGGHISPGIQMRLEAMHTFTAKLPLLKPESIIPGPGKSTKEAMISGAVVGARYEMQGYVAYYKNKHPDLKVILCGGDTNYFDKRMEFNTFALPNLVLEGLNSILTVNSDH